MVKTYSAHSIQAAMSQIKQDIGEDAMIISTRRIPKAPRDPYGKDMFQIEASAPGPSLPEPANRNRKKALDEVKGVAARLLGNGESKGVKDGTAGWDSVQADLGSIRDMLCWSSLGDDFLEVVQEEKDAFRVYSRLVLSGISEKRVKGLMKKGLSDISEPGEDFAARVLRGLISSVDTMNPFHSGDEDGQQVVAAYVGPTGVGKTTTIAKLAAYLSLTLKKKVGLVSVDNYRIGAVDQLKTYSAIIGIPCIPAFTGEDLKKTLNKLSGMDYVLIDTAGQSHLDKARMNELNTILSHESCVTKHLVISASMERLDMKEAVECFDLLSPSSYVFTKVDETRRSGRIIDQMMEKRLPVSFITNGQEVPEDLIIASHKQILQLLIDPDSFRKRTIRT